MTLTRQPDPGAQPSAARRRPTPRTTTAPANNVLAAAPVHDRRPTSTTRRPATLRAQRDRAGRRQPAAHELPALPVRRLHHLAVRDLPVSDLGAPWIRSSPRSGSSRSTSRPRAGRGATASCCRSRRTPRCSRCWGRPTAATASRTSRCPTCRAGPPMHPGPGAGPALHDLGETGGSETVTLLETEIPSHTHALRANAADADGTERPAPAGHARSRRARHALTRRPQRHPAGRRQRWPRRRRPAAQQPAAVPDLLLLHRPAGRLPAADVTRTARPRSTLRPATEPTASLCSRSTPTREPRSSTGRRGRRSSARRSSRMQFDAQDHEYRRANPDGPSTSSRSTATRRPALRRPPPGRHPHRRHRAAAGVPRPRDRAPGCSRELQREAAAEGRDDHPRRAAQPAAAGSTSASAS